MDFSLPVSLQDLGYSLKIYDKLSSTMDQAWHYALTSDSVHTPGVWFLAHEQTGARGRQNRFWHSPKGNFYSSLLLVDPAPLSRVPQLCFVTALAIHEALSSLLIQAYDHPPLRLKWPNDVLIGREKIAGILIETRHVGETQSLCVVIGIGINCIKSPRMEEVRRPAAHLSQWIPHISPSKVFHEVSQTLSRHLIAWERGHCFGSVRQDWLQHAYGLGQPIRMDQTSESVHGIFSDLDETGRLLCTTASSKGIIACDSGTLCFLDEDKKD